MFTLNRGCDARSCKNIEEKCTETDDDQDDLEQSTFTLICKYAVLGLSALSIFREVCVLFVFGIYIYFFVI